MPSPVLDSRISEKMILFWFGNHEMFLKDNGRQIKSWDKLEVGNDFNCKKMYE